MKLIFTALVFAMVGTLAGAFWAIPLGFGGAPGAVLGRKAHESGQPIPTWILILTVVGQLFVSLVFTAFVVESARSITTDGQGIGKWLMWAAAWWVASVPTTNALKDSAAEEVKNVQHAAMTFTAPLSQVGFFLFVFFPSVLELAWGWVPHL